MLVPFCSINDAQVTTPTESPRQAAPKGASDQAPDMPRSRGSSIWIVVRAYKVPTQNMFAKLARAMGNGPVVGCEEEGGRLRAMIFDIVIVSRRWKTREEVKMPGYEDGGSRSYISCGAMPLYRFWKVSIHLCFVISKYN
jgi:hypothetical protein